VTYVLRHKLAFYLSAVTSTTLLLLLLQLFADVHR